MEASKMSFLVNCVAPFFDSCVDSHANKSVTLQEQMVDSSSVSDVGNLVCFFQGYSVPDENH